MSENWLYSVEDLRGFLKINKSDLDNEIVEQPTLFYVISEKYAKAVSQRDAAYENIKRTDARLDSELRLKLTADGEKVTETKVSAAVQQHPDHTTAHQDFLDLKLEAETLGALRDAFAQRSYMLRDLVQLYMANYYMEDSVQTSRQGSSKINYEANKERLATKRKERKSLTR